MLRSERRVEGFTESFKDIGYQGVLPGDLVVHSMDGFAGAIGVAQSAGKMSPVVHIYSSAGAVDLRFVAYYLRELSANGQIQALAKGIRERSTSFDPATLSELNLPLPPIDEQRRIADFLDDQVARIDNIVVARRRQVGLLDEAFSSLAEAKLWPVAIPSTWTVDRLSRWVKIGNGSTPQRDNESFWQGGDLPWLNSSVVNLDEVTAAEQFVTQSALARCHLPLVQPGSVLVGLTGEGRTRGMATLLSIPSTISQHLAFVTGDGRYWQPRYLLWALRSAYGRLRLVSDVNGSTKGGLTCRDLGDLRVPRPTPIEQIALIAEIEKVHAETRSKTELLKKNAGTLDELKRSLITAAVTGEFDVSTASGSQVPA